MRLAFNVTLFVTTVAMFAFATTMIAEEPDPMAVHTDSNPPNSSDAGISRLALPGIQVGWNNRPENTPTPEPTMTPTLEPTSTPQPARVTAQWESAGALSEVEMRSLAVSVGFPPETIDAAIAIARCESGFHPNATGAEGEMGLWQIHPRWHSDATYDVVGNARAAYRISSGGYDWSAWSCRKVLR